MDIAAWLRSLELEQYEPAFRENEIDADVLPGLTEAHLERVGLSLGQRLKLLARGEGLRWTPKMRRSAEVEPCPCDESMLQASPNFPSFLA